MAAEIQENLDQINAWKFESIDRIAPFYVTHSQENSTSKDKRHDGVGRTANVITSDHSIAGVNKVFFAVHVNYESKCFGSGV